MKTVSPLVAFRLLSIILLHCILVSSAWAQRVKTTTVRPSWVDLADGPSNSAQVATATDGAGLLHLVTWVDGGGSGNSYQHRTVSTDGSVSAATTILSTWEALNFPQLLSRADGTLSLLFFGSRNAFMGDPFSGVHTKRLTSDTTFTTWTLDPTLYDGDPGMAFPGANSGAIFSSTQEIVASTQSGVVRAFNLATLTAHETSARTCCAYLANLATDPSTGELVAGFYSNSDGDGGLFFQALLPALGAIVKAPGSGADPRVIVPLASNATALFSAYGNESRANGGVRVWKVGTASEVIDIPQTDGATGILLVSDGTRFWAVWGFSDGTTNTYVARSNRSGTAFGRKIKILGPTNSASIFNRSAVATRGHLDLFTTASGDNPDGSRYARIGIPLEMTVRPRRLGSGSSRLRVKVTDGDNPVAGARVRAPGSSALTNARGVAFVTVNRARAAIAASKAGYTSISVVMTR